MSDYITVDELIKALQKESSRGNGDLTLSINGGEYWVYRDVEFERSVDLSGEPALDMGVSI